MVTRTSQERFRTEHGVFDTFTKRNLFEMQSKGLYDEIIGPLEVGKESNVFVAKKGKKRLIIKIYRVQNADFKRMFSYIKQDPRYDFLKNKRRDIIFAWTQREYKNLLRAQKGKVKVPKALYWKYNIILEEFIGDEEVAPPLKDTRPEDPKQFLKEVIKQMKLLYRCGLVHGDLSAFNILNYNGKPILIDFSQSTLVRTPNSLELLERDVKNVLQFFKKLGVKADFKETLEKIKKESTKK
jgi:RIO kinase 1